MITVGVTVLPPLAEALFYLAVFSKDRFSAANCPRELSTKLFLTQFSKLRFNAFIS